MDRAQKQSNGTRLDRIYALNTQGVGNIMDNNYFSEIYYYIYLLFMQLRYWHNTTSDGPLSFFVVYTCPVRRTYAPTYSCQMVTFVWLLAERLHF